MQLEAYMLVGPALKISITIRRHWIEQSFYRFAGDLIAHQLKVLRNAIEKILLQFPPITE